MKSVSMSVLVSAMALVFSGCQGAATVEPSTSGLTEVKLKLPDRSKLPAEVRSKLNAFSLKVVEGGLALAPEYDDSDQIDGIAVHSKEGAYVESTSLQVSLPVGRYFYVMLKIGDASQSSGKLQNSGVLYQGAADLDLINATSGSTIPLKIKLQKASDSRDSYFLPDSIDTEDAGDVNVNIESEIDDSDPDISAQPFMGGGF